MLNAFQIPFATRCGCVVFLSIATLSLCTRSAEPVDFSRQILPLFSDKCFKCHGPDEANREAGLRLDTKQGAFTELDSGDRAIIPGDSAASILFRRITADDVDLRMPPADSGKSLTDLEIVKIKQWIDEGAEWSAHWAFKTPTKPPLPDSPSPWCANPIDQFIEARQREKGLSPEPMASKETLIRRATLDLTGLPPTIKEIDDFLADHSQNAYERVVDRLLSSNKYGEQMARVWLDAARYADTHGLHLDNERSIWPYRQWVIDAFNSNMPFDQFTVEQLGGDLLPDRTLDQLVATGFNRCNVTTGEGGTIDEEYYVRYAVERVETTATVWLGLTAGCAACHDHKFDPLTQKEFYQFFSYFFSLTEKALDGNVLLPPPSIKVPDRNYAKRRHRLTDKLSKTQDQIDALLTRISYTDPTADEELELGADVETVWFDDSVPTGAKPSGDGEGWNYVTAPDHPVYSGENSSVRKADGLSQHLFVNAKNKLKVSPRDRLFAYVYLDPNDPPETIQLQFNDGSWEHRGYWGADKGHAAGRNNATNLRMGDLPEPGKWHRLEIPARAVGFAKPSELNGWAFTQFKGKVYWDKAGLVSAAPLTDEQKKSQWLWEQYRARVKQPPLPTGIQKLLDIPADRRTGEQAQQLTQHYLQHIHPEISQTLAAPRERLDKLNKSLSDLEKSIPATLIMENRKVRRQAHVLERGQYTLKRDRVESQVPQWILPASSHAPRNRLGLARWLVDPQNPLTSRVTTNRMWQHFFGTGLVKTSEDFGVQGERPSHPHLLDWLAVDFVESGWNVKRMHKLLVMSSTYRQDSRVHSAKLAIDPENRFLARGPRFRLDAEVVRDQALAVSGLLVDDIGGESVKPYQPAGLWKPVGFGGSNTREFKQDSGSKLYRRSMYTFIKRTSPPPSMSTFDAPNRETCQVRRARTNTPLQALVLMNDVQFVEAARKAAERIMLEGGAGTNERITFAFRSLTARRPTERELETLATMFAEYESEFRQHPESAEKLLATGESPRDESLAPSELCAWTMITHVLLNLHETITRG